MGQDQFNAVLRTSGKTILALATLIIVGVGGNVVYLDGRNATNEELARCSALVKRYEEQLATGNTEPVTPLRRLESLDSQLSDMLGAGRRE